MNKKILLMVLRVLSMTKGTIGAEQVHEINFQMETGPTYSQVQPIFTSWTQPQTAPFRF